FFFLCFFFFQAEDGIRDFHVTGVQTCALPISYALLQIRPRTFARFSHTNPFVFRNCNPTCVSGIAGVYTIKLVSILFLICSGIASTESEYTIVMFSNSKAFVSFVGVLSYPNTCAPLLTK